MREYAQRDFRVLIACMWTKICFLFLVVTTAAAGEWKQLPVGTTASFRGLSAVSGAVVWASGTNGTVIRTIDGGQHWDVRVVRGAEKLDFRGIVAFDSRNAVIISSGNAEDGLARIYATSDAGESWRLTFQTRNKSIFFDGIAFWDRQHGIVLSDPVEEHFTLFVTSDGGSRWKLLSPETMPTAFQQEGSFAASNSALAVRGRSEVWFATGGSRVARIFRSTDQGASWRVAETAVLPKNASTGIFSLAFVDANQGIAVGGDYARPAESSGPNVLVTGDGGVGWQAMSAAKAPEVFLSSVVYKLAKHCAGPVGLLAGGPQGIFSVDTGGTWKQMSRLNINVLAQPEPGVTWAVGPQGMVAVARDLEN